MGSCELDTSRPPYDAPSMACSVRSDVIAARPRHRPDEARRTVAFVCYGLAALVVAGYYKGIPALAPLPDLTAVAALLTATGVAVYLLSQFGTVSRRGVHLFLVAGLLTAHAPFLADWDSSYGRSKLLGLYALTLFAILVAGAIITTRIRRSMMARALFFISFAATVPLAISLVLDPQELGRIAYAGGNPIPIGRLSGYALLYGLVSLLLSRRLAWLAVVVPSALVLAGSGSRAPVLAVVLAATVALYGRASNKSRGIRRATAVVVLLAVAISASYAFAPTLSRDRLQSVGRSGELRTSFAQRSLDLAAAHPLGIGWGDFASKSGSDQAEYPHNIVLELVVEAGWFAGIAFVALLFTAFRRSWRSRLSEPLLLASVLFWFVNSLFSADINGNRAALAWLFVAAVCAHHGDKRTT